MGGEIESLNTSQIGQEKLVKFQLPLFFKSDPSSFEKKEDWHDQILKSLDVTAGSGWPDRFGEAIYKYLQKMGHIPIRTLSLFSGCGGLDIAFHNAGFDMIEMVEIDPRFAATLEENTGKNKIFKNGIVRCIDIRDYSPPTSLNIDFIIGGPPCQTFSAAGRRASGVNGTDDPRGTLFEEYVRLLNEFNPKGFLFENVYGIVGAQGGNVWKRIQTAFEDVGYRLHWRVLDAADYGTPQHRERLIIVGLREGEFQFPFPTHGPDSITPRPFYTAGEATQGVSTQDSSSLLINGRWGKLIPSIPPGLNYSFYTEEMGHPNPIFAWRSKFSDFMYKADPEAPIRTIKAQGGLYTGPFSWENRHFSIPETKRLQTIPDNYEIIGTRQVSIHQIGNSVPPQFGRILALSILNQIFKVELPFPMHYMHDSHPLNFRARKRFLTSRYAEKAKKAISNLESSKEKRIENSFPSKEFCRLTETHDLLILKEDSDYEANICYSIDKDNLGINSLLTENKCLIKFEYEIRIYPKDKWLIPVKSVTLRGFGSELKLFTILWKAFERFVKNSYGIDDLVQLSGYYQYSPKFFASMEIDSKAIIPSEWKAIQYVAQGAGVSKTMPVDYFTTIWNMTENEVLNNFYTLRSIGYEIRNHNTNPQIKIGHFLIPYSFPTLNSRSVQIRKKF